MTVAQRHIAQQYSGRGGPSGLADVLEVLLDKGLVIDAYVRVSLIGIELLTVDVRVVVASVDTYLRFAEAVNRLDLTQATNAKTLGDLVGGESGGSSRRSNGSSDGARSARDDADEDEDDAENDADDDRAELEDRSDAEERSDHEPERDEDAPEDDGDDDGGGDAEDGDDDAGLLSRIKERGQAF